MTTTATSTAGSNHVPPPALRIADSHDLIRVQGARVNNLKDVHLEIPKRRLTVFTGVSGSGKSSLVFGTIAAESQRMINETYSAFVQGFMPTLARPDVDVLDGLTVDAGDWWFNLRPSNTEPLLRLNLEAATADDVTQRVAEVTAHFGA